MLKQNEALAAAAAFGALAGTAVVGGEIEVEGPHPPTSYIAHLVEGEGWTDIVLDGLNNSGIVVGNGRYNGSPRGFMWIDGEITELPPLPGHEASRARAINDNGDIVGYSTLEVGEGHPPADDEIDRATMWSGGKVIDLGGSFEDTKAVAINNNGDIAGHIEEVTEIPPPRAPGSFTRAARPRCSSRAPDQSRFMRTSCPL